MKTSFGRILQGFALGIVYTIALCGMCACTVSNDTVSASSLDDGLSSGGSSGGNKTDPEHSDPVEKDSAETDSAGGELNFEELFNDYVKYLNFKKIPSMEIKIGSIRYSVDSFYIATTEVTQGLYEAVMDTLPKQDKQKESLPVVNVSWYDAVLFCNALSKKIGLDTAYVYESIGDKNYLKNLTIDYSVASLRLPTETEWEIAALGGVVTRFYWGDDEASDYAYYGQSKGPVEVGSFKPNDYGLYDMAGNVAEWVNDWFGSYATADKVNPTGPETGNSKCVRGGGWLDKVVDIAPKERSKKDPLYHGVALGFRIIYSNGF